MTDLRASDAPLCCHRFHPLWVGTAGGQLVCGLVRTRTMTDLGASDAPLCCHRFHPLWVGTAGGQLVLLHPGAEQLARDVVPPRQLAQARPATQVLLDELPLELDRVGSIPGHASIPRGPLSLPHLATRARPAVGGQSRRTLPRDPALPDAGFAAVRGRAAQNLFELAYCAGARTGLGLSSASK